MSDQKERELLVKVRGLKIEGRSGEDWNQIVNGVDLDLHKGEVLGLMLLTEHNLWHYQALMQRRRPGRQKIRNRFLRGIYLSAIRSYLFNQVLAQRVKEGNWCSAIAGDALLAQPYGALSEGPTGPLWGRGRSAATAEAADVEQRVLAPLGEVAEKLEYAGLDHERRSLVLLPGDMTWQWLEKAKLQVAFTLPAGGFATAVLRELCLYRDQSSIDRAQAGNTDMRPDKNNNNGIQ